MKAVIFSILILVVRILSLSAYPNLEESAQDFILETKRVILPEYPNAFNPSIVHWKDELWMSFRMIPDPDNIWVSYIGIVRLDESFEPIGNSYILNCLDRSQVSAHSLEDARLISSEGRLYIVYNDHHEPQRTWLRRVCFAELDFDGENFQCKNYDIFLDFEGVSHKRKEKNWSPFSYQGEIFFSYTLQPHRIIRSLSAENCETVFTSAGNIRWNWGEVRGGTSALLLKGEYFAFFHSMRKMKTTHSNGKSMLHYFIGAYTFSSEPPFSITRISKEPIVGKGFYKPQDNYYWGARRVVYPCGCVIDKNFIYVSYGREDREMWVAKIDKTKLLDSLVPVTCEMRR